MFDIPDHPDIECALRTGYPRSYDDCDYDEDDDFDEDDDCDCYCDEDAAYEERRERELFGDDY